MALLAALGHVANFGQFVEIGQGRVHQKEQMRWTKRSYELDSEALKIDLLGAARDDVRGTYDTYVERLDSLLLLNALLLPFALTTLQFSDEFVPGLDCLNKDHSPAFPDPDQCIEAKFPWVHTIWVWLVGIDLFIPFWSILVLLHCKKKLDSWLQRTLDDLQQMRKAIISTELPDPSHWNKQTEETLANDQKRIVSDLGGFIVDYQDLFMDLWTSECAPRVRLATNLLWSASYVAVTLTAYMFYIYLVDRDIKMGMHDNVHFGILSLLCISFPTIYFLRGWLQPPTPMPSVNCLRTYENWNTARGDAPTRTQSGRFQGWDKAWGGESSQISRGDSTASRADSRRALLGSSSVASGSNSVPPSRGASRDIAEARAPNFGSRVSEGGSSEPENARGVAPSLAPAQSPGIMQRLLSGTGLGGDADRGS